MASAAFLLSTLLSLATGALYGYVGWRLSRRQVEGPSRLALGLFTTWWASLAVISVAGALVRLGVAAGAVSFPLYLTYVYLSLLLLCLALWGLLYYLVYLLTGSRRSFAAITVFYAALFVSYVYLVTAARPQGVTVEGSRIVVDYARELAPGVTLFFLATLLGPQLVASIGYFRLFFKVDDRTARYRIGLVSSTIFTWFLSSAVGAATEATTSDWWLLASSLIALAASLLILAAYLPPRWVRDRWGIAGVDEPTLA